jgi:hypothetical protein
LAVGRCAWVARDGKAPGHAGSGDLFISGSAASWDIRRSSTADE